MIKKESSGISNHRMIRLICISILVFYSISLFAQQADSTAGKSFTDFSRFSRNKPNYFLVTTINNSSQTKFQLSFKYQLIDQWGLYIGYSQKSFWDAWDFSHSSPFRETNYNPEIFYDFSAEPLWFFSNEQIGVEHESNGRDSAISRSWNRVYAQYQSNWSDSLIAFRIKFWVPFLVADENADIRHYLGDGDVEFSWRPLHRPEELSFTIELKKGTDPGLDKSGVQLDMAMKPFELLHLTQWGVLNASYYFQYYHGYGESLETYNISVNNFRIGFILLR